METIMIIAPIIGALAIIMSMLREHMEHESTGLIRVKADWSGLSRIELARITRDVLRRDRRRGRYGWMA